LALKGKPDAQLYAPGGPGGQWLANGRGRKDCVYGSYIGVIQKVCASRVEGESAGTIFIPGVEREGTAQIDTD